MKAICTICNEDWGVRKYKENINSFICPDCRKDMKQNKKIELGGKKRGKKLQYVCF